MRCCSLIRQVKALQGLADGLPDNVDLIVLQQVYRGSVIFDTISTKQNSCLY